MLNVMDLRIKINKLTECSVNRTVPSDSEVSIGISQPAVVFDNFERNSLFSTSFRIVAYRQYKKENIIYLSNRKAT